MMANEWSHKQRRSHAFGGPNDTVRMFAPRRRSDAAPAPGEAALDLVDQAAEAIRELEDHARELESRSRVFAEAAVEKLKCAEQQVQSMQDDRMAAEARIADLHNRVREMEEALAAERARVAAAESRLPELERRARIAEARAAEFESAVRRVEHAIRTKILKEGPAVSRKAAAA